MQANSKTKSHIIHLSSVSQCYKQHVWQIFHLLTGISDSSGGDMSSVFYVIQLKHIKFTAEITNTCKSHHSFAIKMIQDCSVKKHLFEVLAKCVSYETTPDWLWPCNLTCASQLNSSPRNAPLTTALQLFAVHVKDWFAFLVFLIFDLIMQCCWQGGDFDNLTAWLRASHGSQASLGTFNAGLKLAFSGKKNQNKCLLLWV